MISFDFRDKIVFFRWTLCLMDKNGILCPSKNVTLACEHVSYLENGLVLMAQMFTIFSFCKYVQFRYHYGFQYSGQRKLFKKMCFPYTTRVLAPSIMRYAVCNFDITLFYAHNCCVIYPYTITRDTSCILQNTEIKNGVDVLLFMTNGNFRAKFDEVFVFPRRLHNS